ncbi:uncharacterized protein [Amphiura filiformis]|uniref:uncharacterized protein n=1 Tax=Amphiura filiformis TaxID=82378 RepID=UPI003B2122B8
MIQGSVDINTKYSYIAALVGSIGAIFLLLTLVVISYRYKPVRKCYNSTKPKDKPRVPDSFFDGKDGDGDTVSTGSSYSQNFDDLQTSGCSGEFNHYGVEPYGAISSSIQTSTATGDSSMAFMAECKGLYNDLNSIIPTTHQGHNMANIPTPNHVRHVPDEPVTMLHSQDMHIHSTCSNTTGNVLLTELPSDVQINYQNMQNVSEV